MGLTGNYLDALRVEHRCPEQNPFRNKSFVSMIGNSGFSYLTYARLPQLPASIWRLSFLYEGLWRIPRTKEKEKP